MSNLKNVGRLFFNMYQIDCGKILYRLISHIFTPGNFSNYQTFIFFLVFLTTYRRPLHAVQTKLPTVTLKYTRISLNWIEKTCESYSTYVGPLELQSKHCLFSGNEANSRIIWIYFSSWRLFFDEVPAIVRLFYKKKIVRTKKSKVEQCLHWLKICYSDRQINLWWNQILVLWLKKINQYSRFVV